MQNSFLRVRRAPGSAAERRGARLGLESGLVASAARARLSTPGAQGSRASGTVLAALGRRRLRVKHTQNQSKVAGGGHPAGSLELLSHPKSNRKTLPKCIFTAFQNQRENRKKKCNLPRPATILHFERPFNTDSSFSAAAFSLLLPETNFQTAFLKRFKKAKEKQN